MGKPEIADKTFDRINFTQAPPEKGNYENCTFVNCIFTNTDLSAINFSDCSFTGCDFSMARLTDSTIRDVAFKDCKLLGLLFQDCNETIFKATFEGCNLNLSSFYKLRLKKIKFKACSLQEADFTEADLSGALFDNCDLGGATFENTLLEKADLRTAYNYAIHPELNHIKGAKFSVAGIPGLLQQYGIEIEY